jgi:hypothetical protein
MNLIRNEPYSSLDMVAPPAALVKFEEGTIQDQEMYLPD